MRTAANTNRKLKRAALGLFTGFLLLAPPGTLIVLSLFLVGIFGKAGLLVLIGIALLALTVFGLRRKKRHSTLRGQK